MKRSKTGPGVYGQKTWLFGLRRRAGLLTSVFVIIAVLGFAYGYRVMTQRQGQDQPKATSPEKNTLSHQETTAEPFSSAETKPKQEKAASGKAKTQDHVAVRVGVTPSRQAKAFPRPSRQTPVSPEYARKLVNDLLFIPRENTQDIQRTLQEIAQLGALAVTAISEFIYSMEQGDLGDSAGLNPANYRPTKLALLSVLNQIGGEEALGFMVERLQGTTDPEEILLLAQGVETHAPGAYRDDILTAARVALAQVSTEQNEAGENMLALGRVLAEYGDDSVVFDLEELSPEWQDFSSMTLAELPEGEGVPSLIRIVEDPEAAQNDKNFAWRMIAQASRVSPEAAEVIVELARAGEIPTSALTRIAFTLGGKEYRFVDTEILTDLAARGVTSGKLPVTYLDPSAPRKWSDAEIDQRLVMIDQLLDTRPEPVVVDELNQARDNLLYWREIALVDGVRKR